jgi:peptidoglycan L-alanyl-D-glutamate endopeptidase CwlK
MTPEQIVEHNDEILGWLYHDFARRMAYVYAEMFHEYGLYMRATEGLRSMERQATLYAQGRTMPGKIVTWAKPGQSLHHYGCAVDSCFSGCDPSFVAKMKSVDFKGADLYTTYLDGSDPFLAKLEKKDPPKAKSIWNAFGEKCQRYALTWGGSWTTKKADRPHAELTYGLTLAQLKALYARGGLDNVSKAFDEHSAMWPTIKDTSHN